MKFNAAYCVIDLSGGPDAAVYPVCYLDAIPEGGWTDEYKTTRLVLRRIPAGTFEMGSTLRESGHLRKEPRHTVTLTHDFWIGIFAVTQQQWELVMGANPSHHVGPMRPVDRVTYDALRGTFAGAQWPESDDVDATSFVGILRKKVAGLRLDIPTEAQWEYACRAGTTSALYNGSDCVSVKEAHGIAEVGRCKDNHDDGKGGYFLNHTVVGSYAPNAWGLYDMHGNVQEWCLDWFAPYSENAIITDPTGPHTGNARLLRGGSWTCCAHDCRSASRNHIPPALGYNDCGVRLAATIFAE